MQIRLSATGKKYQRQWIFRKLDYTFSSGNKYAITGPNGSGKSTLLQVVSGYLSPNEGLVEMLDDSGKIIDAEKKYALISIAAPYLDLIDEFSVDEMLQFHAQMKTMQPIPFDEMLKHAGLEKEKNKLIKNLSSGNRQRVKLMLAFFTQCPILLLDEPCTNLDAAGFATYHHLLATFSDNKLVLISSNQPEEYKTCNELIEMRNIQVATS